MVLNGFVEIVIEKFYDVVGANFGTAVFLDGEKVQELHKEHGDDVCRGDKHVHNDNVHAVRRKIES